MNTLNTKHLESKRDNQLSKDNMYMQQCFELALQAKGQTSPNPLVGCVIVKNDRILAKGYHKKAGLPHAEKEAFANLSPNQSAKGATLYCNLEPCSHTNKKTPPCVPAIIKHQVARVVISNIDPNPSVNTNGVEQLKQAGIEVTTGILKEQGEKINEVFFHNMRKKETFIHMKIASTLDGNIALNSGESKWITQGPIRLKVHEQRYLYDAIAVGSQTFLKDSPSLNIRHPDLADKELKKIVFSNREKLDLPTDFIQVKTQHINNIPKFLYQEHGICSLYLEAGQKIATSFLQNQWAHKLSYCIAPKILGDHKHSFGHLPQASLSQGYEIISPIWEQFGRDIMCTGKIHYPKD